MIRSLLLPTALALLMPALASAAATIGQPAPAFSAKDVNGRTVSLADYKGKHVVLEWINPGCPFVRKHYDTKNMQGTQQQAVAQGAVWLAVNSTHAGASDYLAPDKLAAWMSAQGAAASATLMDAEGTIGRAYGARTTPHLFVIDPTGKLVYAGAIDSKPSANPADVAGATNYVKKTLGEAMAGRPVAQAVTQPYGCSIKYAD